MPAYYDIPEQYGGKSLSDIRNITNAAFRPDVLAGFLGINQNSPLQAGQTLAANLPSNYSNSGEYQFLQQYLTPGVSPEEKANQQRMAQLKQEAEINRQRLEQSQQQSISTLQSGQEPLKQRYNDIIASIKQSKEGATKQAEIATAREYGKRGIPLSSGAYDVALREATTPISTQFGGLEAQAGLGAQQAQQDILSLIAQIQAGGGQNVANNALSYAQLAEQSRQSDLNRALQSLIQSQNQSLAERELSLKERAPTNQENPFVTLGEGSTLFNLLTGKPLYTAPKTYKTESRGEDPLGLL